ncbi:MAG: flagellar basal body-associated FliL family protein [Treponema sp.]|nr:flagellar basal body-associated FliL family protein [Treponema sp.]
MADNDSINIEEDGAGSAAPAPKKGGMGGLIPALLKWIAIGVGAIILIVTVVIITMKVLGGNASATTAIPISEEYTGKREILDWYTSLGTIRAKTSDAIPASVTVEVVLGYKQADKATATEITGRTIELKDFLRRYFTEKAAEDLKPQNEEKLRIEIRNAINDDILSTSKIRDVRFLQFDVVGQ